MIVVPKDYYLFYSRSMVDMTPYSKAQLDRMAIIACKGLGTFSHWELRFNKYNHASLLVWYWAKENLVSTSVAIT